MFRECFALEKIHGSSAHITWNQSSGTLRLTPGGGSTPLFNAMFDQEHLKTVFRERIGKDTTVYGEYYGGGGMAGQKMSHTYGKVAKFIVFDVKIEDSWLSVPQMQDIADQLKLETVFWEKIPATLEAINAARDADSVQAVRNGMGAGHKREGVVLRPLIELTKNNGDRVIVKHRRSEFVERQDGEPEPSVDPARLQVLEDAQAIANEWVVPRRLEHVLPKMDPTATSIRDTGRVVQAMLADVLREAEGEIVVTKEAKTAIGRKAAELFHGWLKTAGLFPETE